MADETQQALPEVGQRVVLIAEVDRFPDALVRAGASAEVTHADADRIHVRLDEPEPGLAEWNNCLIWDRELHAPEGGTLADGFWSEVESEAPAPGP